MPILGFLPATDRRIRGTVEAVERELLQDGLVLRYRTHEEGVDGLPPPLSYSPATACNIQGVPTPGALTAAPCRP